MKAVASVMKNQDLRTVKGRHGTVREGFRGSIVIVASANAYAPLPNKVAYVTAKHALLGLVKSAGMSLPEINGVADDEPSKLSIWQLNMFESMPSVQLG